MQFLLFAVEVHLGSGSWGLVATALFDVHHGIIFYWNGPAFSALAVQMIGLLVIFAWSAAICLILLPFLKIFHLFRVSRETELMGKEINKVMLLSLNQPLLNV